MSVHIRLLNHPGSEIRDRNDRPLAIAGKPVMEVMA